MVRQYLQLGPRTLAYLDSDPAATDKPVLVLVHAFPLGALMWEPQLKGAFWGWRVLAPDLRGFGGSTDEREDGVAPTIDDYADDVAGLVREVVGAPVVLGGLSMGGYAAFAVMRRTPALVRGLILADTRASADSLEGRAARKAMLTLLEREGPQGVAREMMPEAAGRDDARAEPRRRGNGAPADQAAVAARHPRRHPADDGAARLDAAAAVDHRADAGRGRGRGRADPARRLRGDRRDAAQRLAGPHRRRRPSVEPRTPQAFEASVEDFLAGLGTR